MLHATKIVLVSVAAGTQKIVFSKLMGDLI
jgi:hypothetical protein